MVAVRKHVVLWESEYPPVLLLHDEDDVCPTDMPLVHPDSRAGFCAGLFHFTTRKTAVHGLYGWASRSILGANKEELLGFVQNPSGLAGSETNLVNPSSTVTNHSSFVGAQAFEAEAPLMFVAGQHKGTVDSFLRDISLKQRSGKLDGLATPATNDHMANRAPVVV